MYVEGEVSLQFEGSVSDRRRAAQAEPRHQSKSRERRVARSLVPQYKYVSLFEAMNIVMRRW